jgi:hypothetical protein
MTILWHSLGDYMVLTVKKYLKIYTKINKWPTKYLRANHALK